MLKTFGKFRMQEVASSNLVPNRSAVIALKSMYSGQFFRHGHRLSKTYNNVNLTPSYLWGLDDEVWRKRFAAYSPDNYKYTPRYEVARDIMLLTHSTSVRQSVNQSFSPVLFLFCFFVFLLAQLLLNSCTEFCGTL